MEPKCHIRYFNKKQESHFLSQKKRIMCDNKLFLLNYFVLNSIVLLVYRPLSDNVCVPLIYVVLTSGQYETNDLMWCHQYGQYSYNVPFYR